jgi:hypothetical protein
MNDDDNLINRSLNIGPLESNNYSKTISTIVGQARNDSAKEDFTFARANIREVVENGADAIAKLSVIADQSQNPRAFEVLAKLMDTVTNSAEKLLTMQKTIKELEKANEPHDDEAKRITNNLFVGSTSQLAELLKGKEIIN